ncbi:MAG TPA: hypothetical protein VMW86_04695, partial [Dehalococcoidales bacterium]|nr:hypothetical protein [Dehalococcoidales bacterium]
RCRCRCHGISSWPALCGDIMGGFRTPSGGGIRLLSELIIDADKDWEAMGISNIRELAAGMVKGDLAMANGIILAALNPGPTGSMLFSQGAGADLIWSY